MFAASESDQPSSDTLARFAKNVGKFNGISDSTDEANISDTPEHSKQKLSTTDVSATGGVSSSSEEKIYDLNIWYENTDLVFFSVEKQDHVKSSETSASAHISSEGSVGSLCEPFALPVRSVTVTSSNSTLSSSSASDSQKLDEINKKLLHSSASIKKTKHTIKGTVALYDFIIEHFQKARKSIANSADDENTGTPTTSRARGRPAASSKDNTTPSSTTPANKRKRAPTVGTPAESEDEEIKSTKKAKKDADAQKSLDLSMEMNGPERAVLAKWVDKKFYAGRVLQEKPNSKYVVLFEDGAKKTLSEEHIVFGDGNVLPLENEYVHALVKGDEYEPGLVQSVKSKGETVLYTVACESGTFTVTASDIYLEEDQAKVILAKHPNKSLNSPEPGYSGGANARKDRRQKRYSLADTK